MRHLALVAALLCACAEDTTDPSADLSQDEGSIGQAPPPRIDLVVGQLAPGLPTRLTARTAPAGTRIYFAMSTRGPGQTCPPILGGTCLDIAAASQLGVVPTNRQGYAELQITPPRGLRNGVDVWVQAVAIDPNGRVIKSAVIPTSTGAMACPAIYAPECGIDGITYGNGCELGLSGTFFDYAGPC